MKKRKIRKRNKKPEVQRSQRKKDKRMNLKEDKRRYLQEKRWTRKRQNKKGNHLGLQTNPYFYLICLSLFKNKRKSFFLFFIYLHIIDNTILRHIIKEKYFQKKFNAKEKKVQKSMRLRYLYDPKPRDICQAYLGGALRWFS